MNSSSARKWAYEEFGSAELGDARRERRLIAMAAAAVTRPNGCVSEVFASPADRQAAYDFIEKAEIRPEALAEPMYRAAARRAAGPYTVVAIDGTSLTLTDRQQSKGFGPIGTSQFAARGLKVITSYALDQHGVPFGVLDQQWWARRPDKVTKHRKKRRLDEKETRHWVDSLKAAVERLKQESPLTRPVVVIDREGDSLEVLKALSDCDAQFVIRSNHDRRLDSELRDRLYLTQALAGSRVVGAYTLNIPAAPGRKARTATLAIRVARVVLRLRNRLDNSYATYEVAAVEAREIGKVPTGEKRLIWRLLTNLELNSLNDARRVIRFYSYRWRIEDFHRAWKSGVCDIERTQLRRFNHVVKWASIMAAVAARAERLKHLSRTEPEVPADRELSAHEIRALILLKRKYKKRTETVPNTVPPLGQAVRWIADLGGYTGKSSGGPPGTITIRRGLEKVVMAAAGIALVEGED